MERGELRQMIDRLIRKLQEIRPKGPECAICSDDAVWVRHTQFAGSHHFCDTHARQEKDFNLITDNAFWDRLEKNDVRKG